IHRFWKNSGFKLNPFIAWFITFQFVNIAWVFFRATSWESATKVLKGMFGFNGINLHEYVPETLPFLQNIGIELGEHALLVTAVAAICAGILVTTFSKNSLQLAESLRPNFRYASAFIVLTSFNLIWII
ncbi:MBOAT family protein, partial [Paenibacillus phytohabitans]